MDPLELLHYVDHTQLKAYASWEDVRILCEEAIEYKTASVCIPPSYVRRVKEAYQDKIQVCTVVGFPLGYSVKAAKAEETRQAIQDGADEIDMVINIGDVKNADFDKVKDEIALMKSIVGNKILKVIIETCYLTQEEKIKMCSIVTESGADYIKTSTGFGTRGAVPEDIELFKSHIGKNVRIKAAGGIKSLEDLEDFVSKGCLRVGSSSSIDLIKAKNHEKHLI